MKRFSYLINADKVVAKNTRFWAAAGLDSLYPLVHTEAGQFLLDRMQKMGTCKYLRNHHALSELTKEGLRAGGEVYDEDEAGNPVYHFERMNRVYAEYVKRGIKPVVEMDYLPKQLIRSKSGLSGSDEEGRHFGRSWPNDWEKWRELIRAFTQNLVDTFGLAEVRTWYFEVWNEPDSWPMEEWPQFYRMYDIFVDAVTSVDTQLKVGGPGAFQLPFLRCFLEHVSNGKNYVTGEKGSRIDFISYHIYGMSGHWLDLYPMVMPSVQHFVQDLLWIQRAIRLYPCLEGKEFHLNEWGVSSNYEKDARRFPALAFRNSEYSALFFVKLVDSLTQLGYRYNFPITMMLYWGFCAEDALEQPFNGNRSLTTFKNICKPVQTAHEILAKLGEDVLQCEAEEALGAVGVMANRSQEGYQTLVYQFSEYDEDGELPPCSGDIHMTGMENGCYQVEQYHMDQALHNTYRLWVKMGSPERLSEQEARLLQQCGELKPQQKYEIEIKDGKCSMPVHLSAQSLQLSVFKRIQ